ncbi:valine--tRNA ligase [Bombilactobacillus folatiphilus]|uniref:Valine--tRNA ligase n=1 Tax=Bombilactobacillus folatiphilus TaxID=2923362 RepID=A0ABY4PAJ0_9LACO|nr:valine--tRNA ligase [Bombilactobacillus folatiphilus]UQS82688.1 valine--tRNA ligase [Bombilactobacillus folatiphilus]
MSNQETTMAPKYDHNEVENGRYQQWVDAGLFKPSGDQKAKPYSIVIPPPNVTGKLHLGHAWDTTLQDILIRQKRMQGFDTLYLPGMDHAGIATQAKVEAKLRAEGKTRFDLGRDDFVKEVWKWKEEYAQIIRSQWAKMGLSLDYSRERFTLDEGLSKAVRKVFVDLYNKGLIYRGEYIINWDPELQTALSDIEVEHQDDAGAFYHVKYPFADGSGFIEIATTRPETMPGDVAIAVYPGDERYQDVVGKEVILPLFGRKLPIIEDHYVDPEFGTGMVKITPAHDPNDFKVGNRHDLERINVMNADGSMNENAGKYAGMDRFAARKAIAQDLKEQGYLLKEEPITHSVGHSERSGVQVEPRLSTQWFVKMQPLAEMVLKNQQTKGKVNFVPERFENTFEQWMSNVHDWVISRQLWWGHRIPAWYHKQTGEMYVGETAPEDAQNWEQDPDVLDTWFSSALWPFSTLGWPDEESSDFKRYFPTNALVTGYDIIFFWVARMVFEGLEFTGERPFKDVLIHGLMRDEKGRKMSKSLGNGIDPMDVIDKYGVDALRWFLITGSAPGQDTRFSYEKVSAAWNFINKIWNASRFVIMNLEDTQPQLPAVEQLDLTDQWILSELNTTVENVLRLSDNYEFGEVGRALYNFVWNEFCDWYIELSKATLNGDNEQKKTAKRQVLAYILDQILRLLHPIMPFVTEKIWLTMPHTGQSLVVAEYPVVHKELAQPQAVEQMQTVIELIQAIRQIRSQANAPLANPIDILIKPQDETKLSLINSSQEYIERLGHPKQLMIALDLQAPKLAMSAVVDGAEIYIPLAELVNLEEEIQRQEKELAKVRKDIDFLTGKLNNQGFVAHAPAQVIDQQKAKLNDARKRQTKIQARIAELKQNDD